MGITMAIVLRLLALSTPVLSTAALHIPSIPMSMTAKGASSSARHTLFDIPVSNNGARCRVIIYKKGISDSEVLVQSPSAIGGFRSDEYLAISPQGKVPAIKCAETGLCVSESDTISRYLLDTYAHIGPSFQPSNPRSNQIARFHDMYLTTIQGCLYKPAPPFGTFGTRRDALKEYSKQLYFIADLTDSTGPYLCGNEVSLADAALFPSMIFAVSMFPKFDCAGVNDPPIPTKLQEWYDWLLENDEAFKKVHQEVSGGIHKWESNGRWDSIWLAGQRDTSPETIFDKILSGEIPATIVKEDDQIVAFKDIQPAAPAHVLIIPKYRNGLTRLSEAKKDNAEILGQLLIAAGEIAKDESLGFGDGARIVINDGKKAGQEVFHIHLHVLGGRDFSWPPG